MEGKNSFILYKDLLPVVRKMKKEDRGDLFLMILEYVNDLNPETDNEIVELVFEGVRQTLKRDLCKWNEIRGKRSLAGKASAKARSVKKSKQVSTSVKSVEQKSTNPTVSVSDSVTVSDTVTVSEKEKYIKDFFDFDLSTMSENALPIFEGHCKTILSDEYRELLLMNEPLTASQVRAAMREYSPDKVMDTLAAMVNWKDLSKKNKSANLTLLNWLRRAK